MRDKKRQKLYARKERRRGQKVRNGGWRQKVYSRAQFMPPTREKTAKTLRECKETVGCVTKNGRKFTRADKRSEQKVQAEYETGRNGRKFTRE